MKKLNPIYCLFILFVLLSSCKKSSDDDSANNPTDPCLGITAVTASNISAPAGDTMFLYASTVTGASYSWTGPNGFTSIIQNPKIPFASTSTIGAYKVKATVNTCITESTTNLALITYSNPPCTPAHNSYTIGAVSYTNQVVTYDNFNVDGLRVIIKTAGSLNQNEDLTFNSNDVNMSIGRPKNGVYKVAYGFPVLPGNVFIRVEENGAYGSTKGYVCVENYLDANQIQTTKFTWCNITVKLIGTNYEDHTSGCAIYQ